YIHGAGLGGDIAGVIFKAIPWIGSGLKSISFFTYGPDPGPDTWSQNGKAYKPIADAMRLLGRAERLFPENLLFLGRPGLSPVAVLSPQISALWNEVFVPGPDLKEATVQYQREIQSLYYAFSHIN